MPLCLWPRYSLCGICLAVEDFQPLDRVCLRSCGGWSCWSRSLLSCGTLLFGFLNPGRYVLRVARRQRAVELLVRLPPGGNVVIRCALEKERVRWTMDRFHYFYNAP